MSAVSPWHLSVTSLRFESKQEKNGPGTIGWQHQSAGQERVFRSRAGVSWWSQGRSAPLISRKRLQGEATGMFHKHVAVLQLHFVHFLLLKQEKKKQNRKQTKLKETWDQELLKNMTLKNVLDFICWHVRWSVKVYQIDDGLIVHVLLWCTTADESWSAEKGGVYGNFLFALFSDP